MVDKLLNDASYRSYWRGYEYFKEGRVKNIQRFDGTTYSAIVSGCEDYHVRIDLRILENPLAIVPMQKEEGLCVNTKSH